MANGEDGIKSAAKSGDAGAVGVAYDAYKTSMENAGQENSIKPLKDILGK